MSASDEKPMGTVKLKTLQKTGERQVGAQLEDIRADHLARYMWAAERVKKTDRVLDAGCGVGYGAHMLSRVCKSVLAVDSDGDAIDFAQERWSSPNVEFRVGNLHSPDFEENQKFNVVVAFEIIEHLVRPNLFLISLREHLAPGARLYISSPNERVIHHTVELNPFHIRHYTPEALKDLLVFPT